MFMQHPLTVDELVLRSLRPVEATSEYLGWLSDPEVNAYLEVRHAPPNSMEELQAYVHRCNISDDTLLLGIYGAGDAHIGNIKLGPINWNHRRAEIGIIVGEKTAWGKGVATRAIRMLTEYASDHLRLRRLTAGCYEENTGSRRAFEKAGFAVDAVIPDHWTTSLGHRTGEILLGLSLEANTQSEWTPGDVDGFCFIGGGGLMVECIRETRRMGFAAGVLLSTRHADEILPTSRLTLREVLESLDVPYAVVESGVEAVPSRVLPSSGRVLGVGFGPAWILPSEVLSEFRAGIVNFNGIPVPQYIGGAHHTWQILNGNRDGGCYIQEMTPDVDRGDVFYKEDFTLSSSVKVPEDYFRENLQRAFEFFREFLELVRSGEGFKRDPFARIDPQRLYFPRLATLDDGWIDWSWTADEIGRFCDAFSAPYAGASTQYGSRRLLIRRAHVTKPEESLLTHPYCAGLIVRSTSVEVVVAAKGGFVVLDEWSVEGRGQRLREGSRLSTPRSLLPY